MSESVFLSGLLHRRAGAFFQNVNPVDRQILKAFEQPTGPSDLDLFDLGDGAEAKVNSHVVVGNVARPAANFVDERAHASLHHDLRTHIVAIGFAFNRMKSNLMVAVKQIIHQ